jgi:hypothetical protein
MADQYVILQPKESTQHAAWPQAFILHRTNQPENILAAAILAPVFSIIGE